jgi:hypothetical protein
MALAVLLPLGSASADSCANPAEGEPQCCPPHYLVEYDRWPFYLAIPDPTAPPCYS